MSPDEALAIWRAAEQLRAGSQPEAAAKAYEQLAVHEDWIAPARLRLAQLALAAGRLREAVAQAMAAGQAHETDPVVLEGVLTALCQVGELEHALALSARPVLVQAQDAGVQQGVGERLQEQSFPAQARPFLQRARKLGADGPGLHYQLGLSALYMGELDAAEAGFEACLARQPLHAAAHRQLAKLRRATPERNHIPRLRAAIAAMPTAFPDAPPLHYALFKELDDLGETDAAWAALEAGMRARRAQLAYDPDAEAAVFERLMQLEAQGANTVAEPGPVPVFILGQPRSGTTLLERILGGAEAVADAGELRDFGFQLRWCADLPGRPGPDLALLEAAEKVDPAELGRRYLQHTQWHAGGKPLYTDKLPANFLWLGHIARALPQAKFLHLVRDPMDVGFSNLKELFADAYPHSYDQVEMAGHLRRYQALMAHWHAAFPGRILDVPYDALVTDTEATARRVFEFLDLPWQPGVADIAGRRGAVATASAVQLREPVHARFLGQWRRYESRLQPMLHALSLDS
ncbi:MAG TPA: sulfotransferase [Arenimonas sp.]